MSFDRNRRAFAQQFRDEEGMIVFRYRCRGDPVEVDATERDRAIARHAALSRHVFLVTIGWIIVAGGAVMAVMPGVMRGPAAPIIMLVPTALLLMMGQEWASQEPTRHFRQRSAIGERLGRVGAYLMRVEQVTWPQAFAGAASGPLLVWLLGDQMIDPIGVVVVAGLGIVTGVAGAMVIVAKLMLGERRRWRRKQREAIPRARDRTIE